MYFAGIIADPKAMTEVNKEVTPMAADEKEKVKELRLKGVVYVILNIPMFNITLILLIQLCRTVPINML